MPEGGIVPAGQKVCHYEILSHEKLRQFVEMIGCQKMNHRLKLPWMKFGQLKKNCQRQQQKQ